MEKIVAIRYVEDHIGLLSKGEQVIVCHWYMDVGEGEQLFGLQPSPARLCLTKLRQWILRSPFTHNSVTSLGFMAVSLRLLI